MSDACPHPHDQDLIMVGRHDDGILWKTHARPSFMADVR